MAKKAQPSVGALYGRQSRTKGESESIDTQVDEGREAAARHGVELRYTILEPPSTGAYRNRGRNRPRFPELLDLLRSGEIDCVVAYKTDRLSRGGGPGWAPLFEAAEHAGLDLDRFVLIVGHGWMSEFEIGIRATMDREESKKTSDRLADMQERRAASGKPSGGGYRPFGYDHDHVTVVESEAVLIREAADRVLAGEGTRSVARDWNERGIRTPTGREWRETALRICLQSHRIAGMRATASLADRADGTVTPRRPKVMGKATWEPIVPPEQWEELQAVFRTNAARQNRGAPVSVYLLSRIARCSRCGAKLGTGRRSSRRAYACLKAPGMDACGGLAIVAGPMEELVVDMVLYRLSSPNMVEALSSAGEAKVDNAIDDVLAAEAMLDQLATLLGAGDMTISEWKAAREPVDARLKAARARLDKQDRSGGALADLVGVDQSKIRTLWAALPFDRQRAVLAAVLERVDVMPARRGLNQFDPERPGPSGVRKSFHGR